jgi:sec-independent protein translocase protein TatC
MTPRLPGFGRRTSASPGTATGEMPFLDYLEELRHRLFKILGALVVAIGIGLFFVIYYEAIVMGLLVAPIEPYLDGGQLAYFSPTTAFMFTLKLGILVGILLALPVVVYQVWAFFSPALEVEEKKVIVPSLYLGLVLFAIGAALAYIFVLPLALRFLMGFQVEHLRPTIEAGQYLGFVIRLLLAFGAVFELPVVIIILSAMGLITPRFMREKRRHAIVGATVLSSLLTPGDLASTLLMMGPMIVLYEVSIVLSAMIYRKKRERDEAAVLRPSEEPPEGAVEPRS